MALNVSIIPHLWWLLHSLCKTDILGCGGILKYGALLCISSLETGFRSSGNQYNLTNYWIASEVKWLICNTLSGRKPQIKTRRSRYVGRIVLMWICILWRYKWNIWGILNVIYAHTGCYWKLWYTSYNRLIFETFRNATLTITVTVSMWRHR